MIKDGKILIGKAEDKEIYLLPQQLNRHGLIAGATGTGKTVTLKVIAESLSELGVPSVIADVKGDLTGMITPGDQAGIQERLDSMGIEDYQVRNYPVEFFDVYRKMGLPIRASVQEMGPLLISRMLDLTDAQEGILNIIFKIAKEGVEFDGEKLPLDIIDLKDLQAMCSYVGEHAKDYQIAYGNITKQSVGAIQRKLLVLEEQGGDLFFGAPELNVNDFLRTKNGEGVMNIIESQALFTHPLTYSVFIYWLLQKIYENFEEVGDLDKPKLVFFFDEAHTLFDNANRALLEKIEQTIKLVRSKGVAVFFITQIPGDIPSPVLSQLSNRIQHSLRAYTPAEIKAAKLAAESFRDNENIDEAELISNMKTGTALVSGLDEHGAPSVVECTKILPPKSDMGIADTMSLLRVVDNSELMNKYAEDEDPISAYESVDEARAREEQEIAALEEQARLAKEEEKRLKEEQKAAEKAERERQKQEEKERKEAEKLANQPTWSDKLAKKAKNKAENELLNMAVRQARKYLKNLLK